jgi:hypothetical protein
MMTSEVISIHLLKEMEIYYFDGFNLLITTLQSAMTSIMCFD